MPGKWSKRGEFDRERGQNFLTPCNFLILGFSGRSNYFALIAGQDDNTGQFDTAQVTDVADFTNPTHACQTLADFPIGDDWFPQGGWVSGQLTICSTKDDLKCYFMSEDGKYDDIFIFQTM